MKSRRTASVLAMTAALIAAGCASLPNAAELPTTAVERVAQVAEKAPTGTRARDKNRVPTPAEMEIERELRASGIDQVAKSFVNEEMMGLLFGMFRNVLSGKENAGNTESAAIERKMEKMADELPKKMGPILAKVMDLAEAEMKRAMKDAAAQENTRK